MTDVIFVNMSSISKDVYRAYTDEHARKAQPLGVRYVSWKPGLTVTKAVVIDGQVIPVHHAKAVEVKGRNRGELVRGAYEVLIEDAERLGKLTEEYASQLRFMLCRYFAAVAPEREFQTAVAIAGKDKEALKQVKSTFPEIKVTFYLAAPTPAELAINKGKEYPPLAYVPKALADLGDKLKFLGGYTAMQVAFNGRSTPLLP